MLAPPRNVLALGLLVACQPTATDPAAEEATLRQLATEWAAIRALYEPDGPFTDETKFVAVWERRDDEWKALENTWSPRLPAGGGGE